MQLHIVKVSPSCRAVWLYCIRNKIKIDLIEVDLFAGEHKSPAFLKLNPHGEVPVLVDGETSVFEACAILRYLAFKYTDHKDFGKSMAERMKTLSFITWASSELHRVVGYRIVYPQFFEKYHLPNEANDALIDKGMHELTTDLETLEHHVLPGSKYLCGEEMTIADLYVATILVQLEWIDFDFSLWPKIINWMQQIKEIPQWAEVHEKHYGFVKELKK
eukprot:Seg2604.4 transcript_id=Seg2604.4/GoldUCD/mRNA.D3Y31 product="Glutathione S-transferase 1 isoform D" protein_id=Seg2604.4/GoldUCD/D3Y31